MDSSSVLDELTRWASRYCINLNGRVVRHSGTLLRGSSSVVHEGTLSPDAVRVAVKAYLHPPSSDTDDLRRAFEELRLLSKLRHENILPVLGISTEFDLTVSIISQWIPLGNAHTYVQNTENDPRPLLEGIASGLYYLHNHELGPIVHGSLKGSNVLISSDRRALLTDFGVSTLHSSTVSMTVDIRGVPLRWVAPELLEDCTTSTAGDVWAFGMTMLELFTRDVPLSECRSPVAVINRLFSGELPPRPTQRSTEFRLADAWWEICTLCWRHDPSLRPTMRDIMEKVKAAISQARPALTCAKTSGSAGPISNEGGSHPTSQ